MKKDNECVHCGECCRESPCGFGRGTPCVYLTSQNLCGIYDLIVKDPTSNVSPAFGAGCCRTLFNPVRDEILFLRKGGQVVLGKIHSKATRTQMEQLLVDVFTPALDVDEIDQLREILNKKTKQEMRDIHEQVQEGYAQYLVSVGGLFDNLMEGRNEQAPS